MRQISVDILRLQCYLCHNVLALICCSCVEVGLFSREGVRYFEWFAFFSLVEGIISE